MSSQATTAPVLIVRVEDAAAPARLALRIEEAAASLGVSDDYFRAKIAPDLRLVRDGRVRLVPVKELERWLNDNAAHALGA